MSITSYAVSGARIVRRVTVAVAMVLLVLILAIQAFSSRYGSSVVSTAVDHSAVDVGLTSAIQQQEARGLRCSERPSLTDVILFQRTGQDEAITVMTFDQALQESAHGTGWIRRYCI